jgi:septal ring factor EnvC (AmiA/AmiB activator)
MMVVNFFFTREITTATTEIRNTRDQLNTLNTTVQIQQVRSDTQGERISKLETAREEASKTHTVIEQRLNSVEQRLAIYDQAGLQKHLK